MRHDCFVSSCRQSSYRSQPHKTHTRDTFLWLFKKDRQLRQHIGTTTCIYTTKAKPLAKLGKSENIPVFFSLIFVSFFLKIRPSQKQNLNNRYGLFRNRISLLTNHLYSDFYYIPVLNGTRNLSYL